MEKGNSHLFLFLSIFHELFNGMEWAYIVLDGTFNLFTSLFHGFESGFAVSQILERVKNQEYINAGFCRFFYKFLHDIIWISFVAYQVLAS